MKKKKVYIFNSTSRAAIYGIGTYLTQLIICLNQVKIEFEVVHLFSEGNEVCIEKKENHTQISIPDVSITNNKNLKYYYRNVVYLLKEFIPLDQNYEYIFHLNFMINATLVYQLKRVFKSKIILTIHYTNWSFELLGDTQRLKDILNKEKKKLDAFEKKLVENFKEDVKIIKSCNRSVFIAQHTLDSFNKNSEIDPNKFDVINNGLKDSFEEKTLKELNAIKTKYHIPTNATVVLFVGRLDPIKGVDFLIKSFKKVLESRPESILIIIGDGDFSKWYKKAENYWTKIIFTGRLDKKQIYEFYQIANVGVVPSIHEEFGYVAIEMMMWRLPIVVSNVGGLSEIVEDNISGLKVPVRTRKGKRIVDVSQLAEKIGSLLDNKSLSLRLGEGGRKRFLVKYELSIFEDKIRNLFLNI